MKQLSKPKSVKLSESHMKLTPIVAKKIRAKANKMSSSGAAY